MVKMLTFSLQDISIKLKLLTTELAVMTQWVFNITKELNFPFLRSHYWRSDNLFDQLMFRVLSCIWFFSSLFNIRALWFLRQLCACLLLFSLLIPFAANNHYQHYDYNEQQRHYHTWYNFFNCLVIISLLGFHTVINFLYWSIYFIVQLITKTFLNLLSAISNIFLAYERSPYFLILRNAAIT